MYDIDSFNPCFIGTYSFTCTSIPQELLDKMF